MGLLSEVYSDTYYNCKIGGIPLHVDVLRTSAEQAKGYRGRNAPGPNEGLLFLYSELTKVGFWMKDVDFPLQLLAFDENNVLFQIINMHPRTEMIRDVNRPCSKVVEVQQYWCQTNKVNIGAKLEFGDSSGAL